MQNRNPQQSLIKSKNSRLSHMKGVNNIVHQASRATKKQGAKKVVFRFDKINSKITQKIGELQGKGIHGFYFDDNAFFEY